MESIVNEIFENLKIKMNIDSCDVFCSTLSKRGNFLEQSVLYVYGHPFIKITKYINGQIYYNLHKIEDSFTKLEKLNDVYENVKSNNGTQEERLEQLLNIEPKIVEVIIEYLKEKGQLEQVEKERAVRIANNNNSENGGGMRIINYEYPVSNQYIDLVGVRKDEDDRTLVLSYIEYKCKTSSMTGDYGLENHVKNMMKFYMKDDDELLNSINYDNSAKPLKIKKEILVLLSHLDNDLSKQSVKEVLKNIRKLENIKIEDIKICIIHDEKEEISIDKIKKLDETISLLE